MDIKKFLEQNLKDYTKTVNALKLLNYSVDDYAEINRESGKRLNEYTSKVFSVLQNSIIKFRKLIIDFVISAQRERLENFGKPLDRLFNFFKEFESEINKLDISNFYKDFLKQIYHDK